MKLESKIVHGAVEFDEATGSVNIPIHQTSTFKQTALGEYKYEYSRSGNPTREALEKTIGLLEGAEYGLAFASGLAAITTILSLFQSGDKIIIPSNLYGGTFRLLDKIFSNFLIGYEIVDLSETTNLEEVLNQKNQGNNFKAVFIETPTNPLMEITDLQKVVEIAKKNNLLTIVDNTFMSPYLQRPLLFGADIVVHSATKYLGGHSTVVAGLLAVKDSELFKKLKYYQNAIGGVLGPFDSFILLQGIKTLAIRMDRHNYNASQVVDYLQHSEYIEKIYYPGDPKSKGYEIHNKQADGFGGMISFVVRENIDYRLFVKSLKLITLAESLGGVESLICHPASMTHASIPEEVRKKVGIVDRLLRLSVGIEHVDDLIDDLKQAFHVSRLY